MILLLASFTSHGFDGGLRVCFWTSLAVVLYTYIGYPVLMAVLAKLRPRPWRKESIRPSVSVIMAVHNGGAILTAKMAHLLALDADLVREIIVVSDGSTDGTAALLENYTDQRVRVLAIPAQVGKSSALNRAIAQATSEVVLFTDIRPRLEENALERLLSNFADPAVGCVAGELIVRAGEGAASVVGGAYWRYEQWMRTTEATWDSPVGVYGGFYAARRALLRPFPEGLILDDMFQPQSIIRQGYRSVLDREAIVVDTWPATTRGEFQRKVRTLAGNFQLVACAPWVLSPRNRVLFQLVSHKLLRLAVPYALLLLLITAWMLAPHSGAWLSFALMQTAFWAVAALGLVMDLPGLSKIASPAGALLVLNVAAIAGLWRFLFARGPLWKTWAPTTTAAANHLALWEAKEKQS